MFVQYDINIISLLILAVVLFNNVKNGGESRVRQRLFFCMIICDTLLLIVNAVMTISSHYYGDAALSAIVILRTANVILTLIFCEMWAFFCTIRNGRIIKLRGFIVMSMPLAVLIVILILNIDNKLVFTNIYDRGPLYPAVSAAVFFYLVYSFYLTWRGLKSMERGQYYPFMLMPIVLSAVGVANLFTVFDRSIIWSAVAVGLLVIQLFSLDEKMNLDHLTGLYNRKYLDAYIEDLLSDYRNSQNQNRYFAAMMLDIDSFKSINDTHGHVQGDIALINASKMLKKSVRRGDFVARYGGDEFMIVLDRCSAQTPERVIWRLEENVRQYNMESKLPYELNFSVGYKLFSNVRGLYAKDIFFKIDELMYKNKQSKAAMSTARYKQRKEESRQHHEV